MFADMIAALDRVIEDAEEATAAAEMQRKFWTQEADRLNREEMDLRHARQTLRRLDVEVDPEFERLLAEEEEITRRNRETW
jgi:hypothetical protein